MLDDVGQDALSLYNPAVTTPTPNLKLLAENGIIFSSAYANPICSPTRAAIMTGRYAFRTGMGYLSDITLPASELTIPELLKTGIPVGPSYACGAFGKWHMANGSANYAHPVLEGFDRFYGHFANNGDHFMWDELDGTTSNPPTTATTIGVAHSGDYATFDAKKTREAAVSWIGAQTSPFFAYVAFHPPHYPYQVPAQLSVSPATWNTIQNHPLGLTAGQDISNTASAHEAYAWMVEAVDTEIGLLLGGISRPVLENTVVLVISDNGTPGSSGPNPIIQPPYAPLHAKGSVYEQGTKVPLIASGFGIAPLSQKTSGLVGAVDVWATIAELAGAQPPPSLVIDGISFAAMLADPSTPSARTAVFTQSYRPGGNYDYVNCIVPAGGTPASLWHKRAMFDGRYKYIRLRNRDPMTGIWTVTEEAYDLQAVNGSLELVNLWPTTIPEVLALRGQMITLCCR